MGQGKVPTTPEELMRLMDDVGAERGTKVALETGT